MYVKSATEALAVQRNNSFLENLDDFFPIRHCFPFLFRLHNNLRSLPGFYRIEHCIFFYSFILIFRMQISNIKGKVYIARAHSKARAKYLFAPERP